jgi:hypothetical protein
MPRLSFTWWSCLLPALLLGFPGPLQSQQTQPNEKNQIQQWDKDIKALRDRRSLDEQLDRRVLGKYLKNKGLSGTTTKKETKRQAKKKPSSKGGDSVYDELQKNKIEEERNREERMDSSRRRRAEFSRGKSEDGPYSAEYRQTMRLLKHKKAKLDKEQKIADKLQRKTQGKSKKDLQRQAPGAVQPLEVQIEERQGHQPANAQETDQGNRQPLPIPDQDRGKFMSGKTIF